MLWAPSSHALQASNRIGVEESISLESGIPKPWTAAEHETSSKNLIALKVLLPGLLEPPAVDLPCPVLPATSSQPTRFPDLRDPALTPYPRLGYSARSFVLDSRCGASTENRRKPGLKGSPRTRWRIQDEIGPNGILPAWRSLASPWSAAGQPWPGAIQGVKTKRQATSQPVEVAPRAGCKHLSCQPGFCPRSFSTCVWRPGPSGTQPPVSVFFHPQTGPAVPDSAPGSSGSRNKRRSYAGAAGCCRPTVLAVVRSRSWAAASALNPQARLPMCCRVRRKGKGAAEEQELGDPAEDGEEPDRPARASRQLDGDRAPPVAKVGRPAGLHRGRAQHVQHRVQHIMVRVSHSAASASRPNRAQGRRGRQRAAWDLGTLRHEARGEPAPCASGSPTGQGASAARPGSPSPARPSAQIRVCDPS